MIIERANGKQHVLCHRSEGSLPEAVDIVDPAHPILAVQAITAIPAGNDLLRDGAVADGEAVFLAGASPEGHDFADEFMARSNWRLAVSLAMIVAPEQRRALITFKIACTNADRAHPNDDFSRSGLRHSALFETIIPRSVTHDRLHGFGERHLRFCDIHASHPRADCADGEDRHFRIMGLPFGVIQLVSG